MVNAVIVLGLVNALLIIYRLDWGLYFFTAILPFTPLLPVTPIPGFNGTTILILLLFMKAAMVKGAQPPRRRLPDLGWPVLGLFAVTVFSSLTAVVRYDPPLYRFFDYFVVIKRWFIFMFLYFAYRRVLLDEERVRRVALAVTAGLFLEAAFVLKAVLLAGRPRAYGTIGSPNELAQFFASYFMVAVVLFLNTKRVSFKSGLLASAGFSLYGVVATLSRGGFLVTLVSLFVFLLIRARRMAAVFAVLLIFFPGVVWQTLPDKVTDRIMETFDRPQEAPETIGGVGIEASAYSRIPLAQAGLAMFRESPFLGKGFMSFPKLLPLEEFGGQLGLDRPKASHNMHIRVLAELGLLGYAFFLSIFLVSIYLGQALIRSSDGRFDKDMGALLIAVSLGFLVGFFFGDRFFRGVLFTYFFVLAAACHNLLRLRVGTGSAPKRRNLPATGKAPRRPAGTVTRTSARRS